MDLDVAVVGAGVSGAYCAWRLQQALGAQAKIALFEYSDRIGGRLYTVTIPGLPNVKAELGGMRYIPDQHIMVASLVDHLKLAKKDFPMGAPPPVGANCNLFYLRGKHLRLHDLADPEKVPYNMTFTERGQGPTNLQVRMMNNIYPGMENLSLCDLMKVTAYGRPLWKWGFWDLAARVLSNEGYQFMKDSGGYEANVANANAVTQLPATEYSDTTKFLTLRDGYDALPKTLVREFDDTMPGGIPSGKRVMKNHRLHEIQIGSDEYRYTLIFEPTVTHEVLEAWVTNDPKTKPELGAKPIVVRAKKVILALPRRSLELIKSRFFDDPWLKKNVPSVLIQSAFKLLLAYEAPWWRALGLVAGRSVTDLPIRQTYYFGTEAEQEGGEPFMNSLLMASYNDIGTVPFWKGLEEGKRYPGHRPRCLEPGVEKVIPTTEFDATEEMVSTANRQIAAMHAMPDIPLPYAAVYHTWNEDPYGGGWHEWKANYRLDEVMCRMRKPVDDQDIFIVGEAYSYGQGWVEGALDTAESMLEDFFGLARPPWITNPTYPLMPNPCPGCGDLTGCIEVQGAQKTLDDATPSCLNPPPVG
jgi:Flavin containing amine oxidoreductase